jgi:hypothetical protein
MCPRREDERLWARDTIATGLRAGFGLISRRGSHWCRSATPPRRSRPGARSRWIHRTLVVGNRPCLKGGDDFGSRGRRREYPAFSLSGAGELLCRGAERGRLANPPAGSAGLVKPISSLEELPGARDPGDFPVIGPRFR